MFSFVASSIRDLSVQMYLICGVYSCASTQQEIYAMEIALKIPQDCVKLG